MQQWIKILKSVLIINYILSAVVEREHVENSVTYYTTHTCFC